MVTGWIERIPQAGEVWWVQPAPTMGSEQSGKRPFLVVSPQVINEVIHRVMGVSISRTNHGWQTEIPLSTLPEPCVAQSDQIRSIDLVARRAEFRGHVATPAELDSVRGTLKILLGC